MKRLLLLFLVIFFAGINHGYSAWYGGVWTSQGIGAGLTWCPTDGDTTGGSPAFSRSPYPGIYYYDSRVTGVSGSYMYCQFWDGAIPTVTNNYAYNGVWKNFNSVTVTLTPSDTGGSGVNVTRWCEGASCNPASGIVGTSITKYANYNNTIRYQTWDKAGNASAIGSFIIRLDINKPTQGNDYAYNGVWKNFNSVTVNFTRADTGGSGVNVTRWCEGASCNPASGTVATSVTKYANYNNTIRYQTWDVAGNASTIGSFIIRLDKNPPSVGYQLNNGAPWPNDKRTNKNVTSSITCSDTGGSGCNSSSYQYRIQSSNFTCNSGGTWQTGSYFYHNTPAGTNKVEYICYRAKDIAGNLYIYSSVAIIKIDKIVPNPATDLTSTSSNPADYSRHLATNGQIFTVTPGIAGGSQIVKTQGFFEDYNNCPGGFNATRIEGTSTISTTASVHQISKVVPGCDLNAAGYRDYSFKITYLEDDAGNSFGLKNATSSYGGIKTFHYKVFANTLSSKITVKNVTSQNVTSSSNIANATTKDLTITLKDVYGNPIIPATDINRTIDFNFNVNNTLQLQQFNTGAGGTAVFNNTPSSPTFSGNFGIGSYTKPFNSQNPTSGVNGTYRFQFQVYSPTHYLGSPYGFKINSINFDVNRVTSIASGDNPSGITIGNSSLDFSFKPIYELINSGEIATAGFSEGSWQTGSISISHTGTVTPSSATRNFYLSQTGTTSSEFTGSGKINTNPDKQIPKSTLINQYINAFNVATYNLSTIFRLTDPSGYTTDIKNLKLEEYFAYTLGGKNINYLGGVLNDSNSQDFGTLKVYGISNIDSSKQKDLTLDQNVLDIKNLDGDITKSSLKRDIRSKALYITKYVTPDNGTKKVTKLSGTNWSLSGNGGKNLGSVLYFGDLAGTNVEINSLEKLSGVKTIVVEGGNLYINSNIVNNTSSDILGIIVIKDENEKGGNIYIDKGVTRVDAVMYADKSLISAYSIAGTLYEIDGNVNKSEISKQLYINGTLFSENTIGGSRLNPPVCPFYTEAISGFTCNMETAQKYDLNYLRAAYDQKYSSSYPDYPIVIKYNSMLQSTPPPLFGN